MKRIFWIGPPNQIGKIILTVIFTLITYTATKNILLTTLGTAYLIYLLYFRFSSSL